MLDVLNALKQISDSVGNNVEITVRLEEKNKRMVVLADWWDVDYHSQIYLYLAEIGAVDYDLKEYVAGLFSFQYEKGRIE